MSEDPVKYKSEKNLQSFTIDGYTVIAMKLPSDETREVKGALSPKGVGAGFGSQRQSQWECFVHYQKIGLKPLETWKEECATNITQASGANTSAQQVFISPVFPSDELAKCPKCGKPLTILKDNTCSSCHEKII